MSERAVQVLMILASLVLTAVSALFGWVFLLFAGLGWLIIGVGLNAEGELARKAVPVASVITPAVIGAVLGYLGYFRLGGGVQGAVSGFLAGFFGSVAGLLLGVFVMYVFSSVLS